MNNMKTNFIDLNEIEKPVEIKFNLYENKSSIDSIEFIDNSNIINKLSIKQKEEKIDLDEIKINKIEEKLINVDSTENKEIEKHIKKEKEGLKKKGDRILKEKNLGKKQKDVELDNEKKETSNIVENNKKEILKEQNIKNDYSETDEIEELEPVNDLDDEINILAKKAFEGKDGIENPGEINLVSIDKDLSNPDLKIQEKIAGEGTSEEIFGVNRARVFYNIDKEIYSTRSTSIFTKSKLKEIKKGLLFPAISASGAFLISFIVVIIFTIFFRSKSASSLEDNIIKDQSILTKIAKQMEEERRLASLRLEEERKKLEEDKKRLESMLNEELLKKEADIENNYLKKLKELEKGGITEEEKDKLNLEKEEEIIKAREERDIKIKEQEQLLAEKDEKIRVVVEDLKKESTNYQLEITRIKNEYEEKRKEEEKRIELANQRLNELKDAEEKITKFNSFIYQLISEAMEEYKNGRLDFALQNLNSVLKYYNSNLDFVSAHDELKNKMNTDIFFVETINGLLVKSKDSILNNREYTKIINKFNRVMDIYKKAENYHNEGDFEKSGEEYSKVLKEFDEINNTYIKLKDIEKKTQDSLAYNYFNSAKKNIDEGKYREALKELYLILDKAPLSNYKNQSIIEIIKINELLSYNSKVDKNNEEAKILFDQAESFKKSEDYNNALVFYNKILLDYPLSDYTKKSMEESKNIEDTLSKKKLVDNTEDLKKKFLTNYQKYQYYNSKGDFEKARLYYFDALNNSFDIYTDNSIIDFKKGEDQYIELLVKDNLKSKSEENAKILFDQADSYKKSGDYDIALKLYKMILLNYPTSSYSDKSSAESKNIEKNYSNNASIKDQKELREKFLTNYQKYQFYNSRGDFESARIYYFEALRNSFDLYTDNSIINFKKDEDKYIELLIKENLKNKDKYIETLINDYNEKIKKIDEEYKELKSKYDDLEKKYNEKIISKTEKDKIKKEIEDEIKEKYILLKKEEKNRELDRTREEFEEELYILKSREKALLFL